MCFFKCATSHHAGGYAGGPHRLVVEYVAETGFAGAAFDHPTRVFGCDAVFREVAFAIGGRLRRPVPIYHAMHRSLYRNIGRWFPFLVGGNKVRYTCCGSSAMSVEIVTEVNPRRAWQGGCENLLSSLLH